MRVNTVAILLLCLSIAPGSALSADEELPDDEFLEFLGVWDEAWSAACEPDNELPGDDACAEYEDEQDPTNDN
ncbi:MAG: hypothetical protein KJO35_10845 [Gammaproteobacteria bacterium]|nr:hypothetical protein [Gammaproteobacteria bacterium]NNF67455.1 hypothetical protein [Gammaproteobacteria bacterium]